MDKELAKISKFLSLVLRHEPGSIGLTLDAQGWADVSELVAKATLPLTPAVIETVVATNDKKRFALSEDKKRIRANQGHSIPVALGLTATSPPEWLFHGTATRFVEAILTEGLSRQDRQHVHLSEDRTTARTVGIRHGKPVIFRIAAGEMHARGYRFFKSENGVWLTDEVPPALLEIDGSSA